MFLFGWLSAILNAHWGDWEELDLHWRLALILIAVGISLRWNQLMWMAHAPPEPDATAYLEYARLMKPFTETGFYSASFHMREPFFIWVAHWVVKIFGASDFHMRYASFLLSVAALPATWLTVRRGFGPLAGVIALALVATSEICVVESAKGLRTELETLLWLGLFYAGCVKGPFFKTSKAVFGRGFSIAGPPSRRDLVFWAAGMGFVGGLLLLTRSNNAPALLLLLIACGFSSRLPLRRWAPAVAGAFVLSAALLFPHKYSIYKKHGSFNWDNANYARWYANKEFVERFGTEGFPTREEFLKDGTAGPPLSMKEYLFGMHTGKQLIGYPILGYAGIAASLTSSIATLNRSQDVVGKVLLTKEGRPFLRAVRWDILKLAAAFLLAFLALMAAAFRPEGRMALCALVAVTLFSSFFFGANLLNGGHVLEPYRTVLHAFPFLAACVGSLSARLIESAGSFLERRKAFGR